MGRDGVGMSTYPEHPLACMHRRASHPDHGARTALAWMPDPTAEAPRIIRWSYRKLWSVASSAATRVRGHTRGQGPHGDDAAAAGGRDVSC